jgi:hypothetical protein
MARLEILGQRGDGTEHVPLGETASRLQFLFARGHEVRVSAEPSDDVVAVLLRVSRHWVVIAPPGGDPLAVNEVPVVSLKVLDHGDILQVDGTRLRLTELHGETLTADSPLIQQEKACPVCHGAFEPGEQALYCPLCGTGHHDECLRRNHKCAIWPSDGFVLPEGEWRKRKEAGA